MASKLIKRTLEEAAQVEHAEIDFSDKVFFSIFAALRFSYNSQSLHYRPVPILLYAKFLPNRWYRTGSC
jgi:hypothetical protein